MKSIIIAAPNYHPETGAAAKRITAMAEYLAQHGWRVTVVTLLPHYPQNKIYAGYEGPAPRKSEENGVTVIRYRPWIVPKANLALRLLSETVFCLQAMLYILRHKTDVVLASSPYMFLGPLGLLASRLRGTKFVWDVRDLTWQYAKATGKSSYGLDVPLEKLMRFTASKVDALTTATLGQLSYFQQQPKLSIFLPNGLSDSMLNSLAKVARSSGDSQPGVLYAGLLGFPQGLITLIHAARTLPHVTFRFVGDGPERQSLEAHARKLGLRNVQFVGYVPFEELLTHYSWASILVAHLRDDPAFHIAQPSKLWEYMATGKAVIYAGHGETTHIIQEQDIGLCVPPDQPQALAEAIQSLIHDPARATALGERGQRFVATHRRRSLILKQLADLLDAVVGAPKQTEDHAKLAS